MKNNLRAIKYGSEEYIAFKTSLEYLIKIK